VWPRHAATINGVHPFCLLLAFVITGISASVVHPVSQCMRNLLWSSYRVGFIHIRASLNQTLDHRKVALFRSTYQGSALELAGQSGLSIAATTQQDRDVQNTPCPSG
jgi:hypothetical protein